MNGKNTLILLILALGLGAFIYFYEQHQPGTKKALEQGQYLLRFDRDDIRRITIKNSGEEIKLEKEDNQWRLVKPVKDAAASLPVDQILTSAETLRKEGTIERTDGKNRLEEYGLKKPTVRLEFDGDFAPPTLSFGREAAVAGKVYARLGKEETAYVVSGELLELLRRKPDDFRDTRLTNLAPAQIERMVIKSGAGEIELKKEREHWRIVRPLKARADDSRVIGLLSQVTNARIESFLPSEGTNLTTYGLAEPQGTVSLFTEDEKEPAVLSIGGGVAAPAASPTPGAPTPVQAGKVYAQLSTRDSIYTLPSSIAGVLEAKPNDLRDRHLVELEPDIIDRITIAPAGREKIVLARKGEGWRVLSPKEAPANAEQVRALIAALQGAMVENFVADSAADLAKYGLAEPKVVVTFSSYASENTAESNAGESEIVSLAFGNSEEGNVYAHIAAEPSVVAVRSAILDEIPVAPEPWTDATIFKIEPGDLQRIELQRSGQPALKLSRADDDSWTDPKGEDVAKTLASLRAKRWLGATVPMHGMSTPVFRVSFTAVDGRANQLNVGNPGPDGGRYATVAGRDGTFVLSAEDYAALNPETAATPAPAVAPIPAATAVPNATPASIATPAPTAKPELIATPIPAATPLPTATPRAVTPASTPIPTLPTTPTPTATPVAVPPTPTPAFTPKASPTAVKAKTPAASATPNQQKLITVPLEPDEPAATPAPSPASSPAPAAPGR